MTISVNFWFEPTNSTEPSNESQADDRSGIKEKAKEKEAEKEEEERKEKQDDTKPIFMSPQDELALIRDVEISLFKATHDHEKVFNQLRSLVIIDQNA